MTSSAKARGRGGEAPGLKRRQRDLGKMKTICTFYVMEEISICIYIYMMYLAMYINDVCSYIKINRVHILNSNIQ